MRCELNLVYYRLDRHQTQPITIRFHLGSSHCIASPLIYNSLLFHIACSCVLLILLVIIISKSASFLRELKKNTTVASFTAGLLNDELISNEAWSYLDPQMLQMEQWGTFDVHFNSYATSASKYSWIKIFADGCRTTKNAKV